MDYAQAYQAVDSVLSQWTRVWAPEQTLDSLGISSLDRLDLLFQLEKQYHVDLEDLDRPDTTPAELIRALEVAPRLLDPSS